MAIKWKASHDPQERKRWGVNWKKRIGTEIITNATWDKISGADTLTLEDINYANQMAYVTISDGAVGNASFTHTIETDAGMTYQETINLSIKQH